MHLPDWCDDEYLEQLTSEKAIRKYVTGKGSARQWVKTRPRNEAFDLEVYALAALRTRGPAFLNRVLGRSAVDSTEEPEHEYNSADTAKIQKVPANKASAMLVDAPGSRWGRAVKEKLGNSRGSSRW